MAFSGIVPGKAGNGSAGSDVNYVQPKIHSNTAQGWGFFTKVVNHNSAIHKAADRHSSQLEPPQGAVPATSSIHSLWEFQELYQAKSWNGREP